MSDPKTYTIGWICAVNSEYVAAQAILDRKHARPAVLSTGDINSYTPGTVEGHNVVIAVLSKSIFLAYFHVS